ncbi:MAG: S9 family peptidase [Proteobacteria bacterium]|nr:S9 family peptidase [Pseudomonadota bacterium]
MSPIQPNGKFTVSDRSAPPVAERRPHAATYHGITLEDSYHWLKDPDYPQVSDPDVLAYLKAENAYFEQQMEPLAPLIESLFTELKNRQVLDDSSVPWRANNFMYQWRYSPDAQYRTWWRKPYLEDAVETGAQAWTLILDEPALAEGHEYFRLGGMSISEDGRLLAYSIDTNGSERFMLRIRDLTTGEDRSTRIENTSGSPQWSADARHLFYTVVNDQWQPYQVWRHDLDTSKPDQLVYEEEDEAFFVGLSRTQSDAYLIIASGDHVTSEIRILAADQPLAQPVLIAPRRSGHEIDIDHQPGWFWIRSNRNHKNFSLFRAPQTDPQEARWQSVLEGDDRHYLTGHVSFKNEVVVTARIDGLDQIQIRPTNADPYLITFPESAYSADLGTNLMFDAPMLRLNYTSMVTPNTVYDYDLTNRALIERKVQVIPSGYDKTLYHTQRLLAPARDGAMIPISIVSRRDNPAGKPGPLHLYGYGAYGMAVDPSFSTSRLTLLDRGFSYAIAHIRGGDEMGYHWYEAGKLNKRTNTFNDFVDVARYLIKERYTQAGSISISGGSAGGELMGAVVNAAPELWGGVVAHVPFVDVLNTMLDTSLPLTPIEWPEWGNPIEDAQAFALIRSYSPYDQLKTGAYPPMLVTAGLNDPRVTYWEAAKYVAKLRTLKTDANVLLLKTNMGAGHGGKSGRFDSLREVAQEYAFLLNSVDK